MEEIGKLLPVVLKGYYSHKLERLPEILAPFWTRVAGKAIAENSRPVSFRGGNLTLSVSTDCWATQLRSMTPEIRNRINAFLGQPLVSRLSIRCQSGFAPFGRPALKFLPPQADAELSQKARSLLALNAVEPLDPVIRQIVENSFVKYFSRRSKGAC
ncbi:MAG TPA: DUF721 domain-containing protein [Terriglobia bacterium]|nr:DUF721 domain-containing protein [Terriglobia bacterium]